MYRIINQEFHYQFLRLLWLWTLKTGMEDGKYQQYGAIEFLPFAQVSSHEHFESLWGSYLDFPRGGSRAAATSKMEYFVIIVNGFQPLNIITKRSNWMLQQPQVRLYFHNLFLWLYRIDSFSLEVIKGKKRCSGNLDKIFTKYMQGELIFKWS